MASDLADGLLDEEDVLRNRVEPLLALGGRLVGELPLRLCFPLSFSLLSCDFFRCLDDFRRVELVRVAGGSL